ncbi:MAG: DMT family transporter [Bacteriovoracaceae bacterium]|nr:DMT family transporter [Bacteriovoracaceae bacterium]
MFSNALLLIFATAIWGLGFVASRWLLDSYSPLWANSLRYILAAVIATPILFFYKTHRQSGQYLRFGLIASVILFSSMFLQIVGLNYTTVAKNGFITIFYALFTPVLMMIFYKTKYNYRFWILVLLAMMGIGLMCDLKVENFNIGDFYTFLCAILFSFHIVYVDKISKHLTSALEFNLLQCFYMGIMGLVVAAIWGGPVSFAPLLQWDTLFVPSALSGLIFLSIFSSIIAFSIQVHSQKTITPHVVALVFLLESPFAAIFGYWILGESLTPMNTIGAILVMFSIALLPLVNRRIV